MMHHYLFLSFCLLFVTSHGKDVAKAVAFSCGKPSLYLTAEGWLQDENQMCLSDEKEITSYCQNIYVDKTLVNATFTPVIEIQLKNWCSFERPNCTQSSTDHVHHIQPWICSNDYQRPLTVPSGCNSVKLGGYGEIICRKKHYWDQLAAAHCQLPLQISYTKPCLKDGSYLHPHFLGIELVCCDPTKTPPTSGNHGFPVNEDEIVIEKDKRFYRHYLHNKLPVTNRSQEHKMYIQAKQAIKDDFALRKAILEEELSEAELPLDENEWTKDVQRAREKEITIENEFRRKFIAVDEEEGKLTSQVNKVHQDHILQLMEQHEKSAVAAWQSAVVGKRPYNISYLHVSAEHLLYTVERLRTHLLKRLRHKPEENLPSNVKEWKRRLTDVDGIMNKSLSLLDPQIQSTILQYITHLPKIHFPAADQSSDTTLVNQMSSTVNDAKTKSSKSRDRAERIIAKHVHHEHQSRAQETKQFEPPQIINVLEVPVPKPSVSIASKMSSPIASTESIKEVVLSANFHPSDQIPDSMATVQQPTSTTSSRTHSGVYWILSLLLFAIFVGLVVFIIRKRQRRMRLRRAGYLTTTAAVMEVDEVEEVRSGKQANPTHSGFTNPTNTIFSRLRLNGYENPAFKYSNNLIR